MKQLNDWLNMRSLREGLIIFLLFSKQVAYGDTIHLDDAIALAMEYSEQIQLSSLEGVQAEQRVREARAAGLPRVDLSVNYDRNWLLPSLVFNGNSVKLGSENNIAARFNVQQSLFTGGRVTGVRQVAKLDRAAVEEVQKEMHQEVILSVEKGFYELLVARELESVAIMAVKSARKNLDQVEARREAGRSSQYDLLSAGVQVSEAVADSIRAQHTRLLAEMAFKDIIGMDLNRSAQFVGDFRTETTLSLDRLQPLVERALSERPELLQLDIRIQQQRANIAVERAGLMPDISLVASGQSQFQSDSFDLGEREWRKNWGTGIVMQMSIFDGMRTSARVAQAKNGMHKIELEKRRLERFIRLEVEQNWLRWHEVKARLATQEETVLQAEKGLEVAESRYRTGAGTQLEILNAQLALFQSRTGIALAKRDRALSLVLLERAVGVLGQ